MELNNNIELSFMTDYLFKDIRDNILIYNLDPLSKLCLHIALTGQTNYYLTLLHILWLGKYKNLYRYFNHYRCEFPFICITLQNNNKLYVRDIKVFILSLYNNPYVSQDRLEGSISNIVPTPFTFWFRGIRKGKNKYDNRLS